MIRVKGKDVRIVIGGEPMGPMPTLDVRAIRPFEIPMSPRCGHCGADLGNSKAATFVAHMRVCDGPGEKR